MFPSLLRVLGKNGPRPARAVKVFLSSQPVMMVSLALVFCASAYPALSAGNPSTQPEPVSSEPGPQEKGLVNLPSWQPPALKDALGDPLPSGAVLRLGSSRLKHIERANTVAFSPDGKVLASGGYYEQVIRLWDPQTGKSLGEFEISAKADVGVLSLVFSPDGKWLAVGGGRDHGGWLSFRDWKTGKPRWEKTEKGNGVFVITGMAFSPDGKFLATGGLEKLIVWEVATANKIFEFPAGKRSADESGAVAFSSDGTRLAFAQSQTIFVWDWPERKKPITITTDKGPPDPFKSKYITSLAFLPKSHTIVGSEFTYGTEKIPPVSRICFWNGDTGEKVKTIPLDERVGGVALAKDGKFLAAVERTKIQFCDTVKCEVVKELPRPSDYLAGCYPQEVAISPDGKKLALAGRNQAVYLWDLETGKQFQGQVGHSDFVSSVAFSPDGKQIGTGSWDGFLSLWDAATGKQKHRLFLETDVLPVPPNLAKSFRYKKYARIDSLAFSPDGGFVAATGQHRTHEGIWRIWDAKTGKTVKAGSLPGQGKAVAFSPDGKLLAVTCGEMPSEKLGKSIIHVYNIATGKKIHEFEPPIGFRQWVYFYPDGKKLIAAGGRTILIWDLIQGKEDKESPPPTKDFFSSITFSSGADIAALSLDDQNAILFLKIPDGKILNQLRIPTIAGPSISYVLALSPDNRILAAATNGYFVGDSAKDDFLHLIEVSTGEKFLSLHGGKVRAVSVAFSPDGKRFVSGMENGTALVWEVGPIKSAKKPTEKTIEHWWDDLAGEDAGKAFLAVRHLAGASDASVPMLSKKLMERKPVSAAHLQKLIDDLDSPMFPVRGKAFQELAALSSQAIPALAAAAKKPRSLEQRLRIEKLLDLGPPLRKPKILQRLRAIQTLEMIGSPAAREILEQLAKDHPAMPETAEAAKSISRLKKIAGK